MSARRSTLTRLALTAAAGTLVTAAAVTPATADDGGDWNGSGSGSGDPGTSQWDEGGGNGGNSGGGGNGGNSGGGGNGGNSGNSGNGGNSEGGGNSGNSGGGGNGGNSGGGNWESGQWEQGGNSNGHNNGNNNRRYRGRVTASELLLRSRPTRASQVIRVAHRGDIVSIFCKTPGQNVQGNPLWYLLTDGTWAWGAARYIENVGEAPRWC